ncbi:reverse transcriptase [Elysia marginata]|uniref:Reverse transcriptase n=1 Tax=Elysia marginata TaxID=1093978 RepID=A0AAV4FU36_9GAST|nr:reverse transcriptase [Elysia marginata]
MRKANDIVMEIDARNVCILALLDLSAAFDTLDQEIFQKRLENITFGVTGQVSLVEILQQNNIRYHFYADKMQLYKGASPKHISDSTTGLENCAGDVEAWINSNKLKLNDDKTEILLM